MAKSLSNVIRTASGSIPLQVSNGGTGVSTLSGLIKANGTNAFVAATAGTDYSTGTSALTTGIVKSTTTTGALTIAVAADFPLLNQNTTGTAAGLSNVLAIASGGTNSTATPTLGGVGYGTGTAHAYTAAGETGQVLTSSGAGAPSWQPTAGVSLSATNTWTGTQSFNGTSSMLGAVLTNTAEVTTVVAVAATGTINYDVTTQSVLYYTTPASANWTVNVRASSGTSLNTALAIGQSITLTFRVVQGSTAYYNSAFTIDGTSVTPKWQGGVVPAAGNPYGIDVYTYTITKTANATYIVLASLTGFSVPPDYFIWSWGRNFAGQLGLGNTTNYSSPNQVGALTNWKSIACGERHTIAIKTDGSLWSWGSGSQGRLGLGNTTDYSSPKQVGALTNWLSISSKNANTMAIKTDGSLWSWGNNAYGSLGLGNGTYYSSPKQVGALKTWKTVACTTPYSTMAIKTDGTLWSWGSNYRGQLGLGNTTYYMSPKQVGALTTWLSVAGGYNFSMAIKIDGSLWSWGRNNSGQLGLGNTTDYSSPKQVGALTTWLSIASGNYHTIAIKTDGSLWSWGSGSQGRLGLDNNFNYSSPKQVGALTTWLSIASGYNWSMAIQTDGTLWSWGYNGYGQLGLGNTTSPRSSPTQVGALTTWLSIASGFYHVTAIQKIINL